MPQSSRYIFTIEAEANPKTTGHLTPTVGQIHFTETFTGPDYPDKDMLPWLLDMYGHEMSATFTSDRRTNEHEASFSGITTLANKPTTFLLFLKELVLTLEEQEKERQGKEAAQASSTGRTITPECFTCNIATCRCLKDEWFSGSKGKKS